MNKPRDAEAIREDSKRVRERGLRDAEVVADRARDMADWRYHFRKYPWAFLGAAAAVGYVVVPRRIQIVSPDPKTLEKLARKNRVLVETNPKPRPRGMLAGVFGFLGHLLLREGSAFIGQQLGAAMSSQSEARAGAGNGHGRRAGYQS